MKKFTWLLSLASITMPMTLSAQESFICDFESEDQFKEWTIVDNDDDGFTWEYFSNYGREYKRMTAHGGDGLMCSASYDENAEKPLSPDNWLISPEVNLGGVLSFWACGQDITYFQEVFGVFVCVGNSTNPEDFVQVGADKTTTKDMTEYTFDLSEYEGKTGRFAIRHYKTTNMFYLDIDDVCVDLNAIYIPDPTLPANITISPANTTANVTWDGAKAHSWNLRYKVNNPNEKINILWDLTKNNNESQTEGWSILDKDGDSNKWSLETRYGYDPTGQTAEDDNLCFFSESYHDGPLDPDNWLITPKLLLGGTFKFWASNYHGQYPDNLSVYVMMDEEGEELYQLGGAITPPKDWTEYSFDTSEYLGKAGRIVIRHYDSYDQYRIYVDYLSYEKQGDEPAEWIEVSGLTDPNYTIEGLERGTDYIVEVQAYTEKGETEWTTPTNFTTTNNGITTGIKAVGNSNADNRIYNLNGLRVKSIEKGIYISNGKKVIKK